MVPFSTPGSQPPGSTLFVTLITEPQLRAVVLVLLATTLAALLSRLHRRIVMPTVVVEIVLGIVIGPHVLGIASYNAYIDMLAKFGLAFLFFVAGFEIVEAKVAKRLVRLGTMGWAISLSIALPAGWVLQRSGIDVEWWLLGVAVCTTSLGTLVPILSDAGRLSAPFGPAVLGTGIAGEFWPIVVISVFLTGAYGATREVLLLVAFGAIVLGSAAIVVNARPPAVIRVLRETTYTSGQTAVRGSIFLLAALVLLATDAGFDFVLGAFAAGLVVGLVLDSPEGRTVRLRLEGIGFGLLIPIYFVATGMTFDLEGLLTAGGLALALLFLALLLVVRGIPALLWRREFEPRQVAALALCGATELPLIAAIVAVGASKGAISPGVGASLVGAGMVSVLVYPMLAMVILGHAREG